MNFFGQMGAFFLALIFGHIVQATHRFDYPVYVVGAVSPAIIRMLAQGTRSSRFWPLLDILAPE